MYGVANCDASSATTSDNLPCVNLPCSHLDAIKSDYFASAVYGDDFNIIHLIINALLELQADLLADICTANPDISAILEIRANRP